jgi:hypothetical protein
MIPTLQLGQVGRGGPLVAAAASIYNALVAYWEFEENSAGTQFLDSHGSNHLSIRTGASSTASSAVSSSGGMVGRYFAPGGSADRTAYIPRSNTALDLPNSDWTFGCWFEGGLESAGSAAWVMGRTGTAAGMFQAFLQIDGTTTRFLWRVSSDGSNFTNVDSGVTAGAGAPWLFLCTLDRTNNLIRLRVKRNSGSVNVNLTTAFASALYTTASTANFCINDGLSGDSTFFSGARGTSAAAKYDQAFYCTKALTDAEADYLYNSGNGRSYAALKADAGR